MTAGRPTKYQPQYCELAKKFCLLGATDVQLGEFLGVSERTINNWKEEHPEFLQSVQEGKIYADVNVANSLYQRALGYSHKDTDIRVIDGEIVKTEIDKHYPPEPTSMRFWLTNRQRSLWADTKQLTGADDEPLIPQATDLVDTTRRLAFMLAKVASEQD